METPFFSLLEQNYLYADKGITEGHFVISTKHDCFQLGVYMPDSHSARNWGLVTYGLDGYYVVELTSNFELRPVKQLNGPMPNGL
jgi:hypothetical protein